MPESRYVESTTVGRSQSPRLEHKVQDELSRIVKDLLESKGLYQNERLEEEFFKPFADADYPHSKLVKEFTSRPIHPVCRSDGSEAPRGIEIAAMVGSAALGTPSHRLPLGFFAPPITTSCQRCRRNTSFVTTGSPAEPFNSPYPIESSKDTEQVYLLHYRCVNCATAALSALIRRIGLRFQLVGRSDPYRPPIANDWPKPIRHIIQDAAGAVSENDVPAGYYHLRTSVEFYIRHCLEIDIHEKHDGAELCRMYNEQLDDGLKTRFPAVSVIYCELSAGLHSREVSTEGFHDLLGRFHDHIKAKHLFATYSS